MGAALRIRRGPDESTRSWTLRQLARMTELRVAVKETKYRDAFTCSFTPVVWTSGGFINPKCKAWLHRLGVLGAGTRASVFDLSAGLVRARAAAL